MPSLPDIHHSPTHTPFRQTEKHFKSHHLRDVYPSLRSHEILDLSRPPGPQDEDEVWQAGWWGPQPSEIDGFIGARLKAGKGWKGKERMRGERPDVLLLDKVKKIKLDDGKEGYIVAEGERFSVYWRPILTDRRIGCILIPKYLDQNQQLDLLESALADYTRPPNPLSLDTHYLIPPDLFDRYASDSQTPIEPKHLSIPPTTDPQPKPLSTRVLIDTPAASTLGYEEIIARNKSWKGDIPSDKVSSKTAAQLMTELRWANLGWVYQVCQSSAG